MANTTNPRPINRCQYWVEKEPIQCVYWNNDTTSCTFEKEVTTTFEGVESTFIKRGDLFPFCNYIGTAKFSCTAYAIVLPAEEGEEAPEPPEKETAARCVLPDPNRHKSRSPNCSKWVLPPTVVYNDDGSLSEDTGVLNYSDINGYNNGNCNFTEGDEKTGGTDVTCSGFAPHHLGFGTYPFQDLCTISGVTTSGTLDTPTGFPSKYHKPMNYDVLNLRALLGRCKWWDSDDYFFILEQDSDGKLKIKAPEFKCKNTAPSVQNFSDFYKDTENLYIRPPCNGAMPDCVKYTGNLASAGYMPYLSSIYLRAGDKVMAEQILEIRYNLRKDAWIIEDYNEYFGLEAILFANEGTKPEIVYEGPVVKDYTIKAIQTEISDFTCFTFSRKQVLLTKGTSDNTLLPSFPTLIKELKDILIEPIIRSIFETVDNYDDTTNIRRSNKEFIFETTYTNHEYLLILGEFFGNNSNVFAINLDDPSMDFPFNVLSRFKNMYSYKNYFGKVFQDPIRAKTEFDLVHDRLECYFKLLKEIAPDKMYFNEWSNTSAAFAISVKTFFGKNRIFVFDTSTDIYTFATITVRKVFCGGIIAQNSFEVTTTETVITEPVDYELKTCFPSYSPKIKYTFEPFKSTQNRIGAVPYHTYLDTRVVVPPMGTLISDTRTSYFLGYNLYKIKVLDRFFITSICEGKDAHRLIFLGNEGYVLVYIADDSKLHSVIRPWDFGEVNENGTSIAMEFVLKGTNADEEEVTIEMEILEHSSDRLEINQFILKPKNINTYTRLYNPILEFEKGLYVYERWSFGRIPEGEDVSEIRDGYPLEDVNIIKATASLEGPLDSGEYVITDLPTTPIVASVIFKGELSGRIKGQVKSDLIVWVKKPYCSDVEIMYTWQANYQETLLLPNGYCFVKDIDIRRLDTHIGGSSPRCGDHSFGRFSTRPSLMWYPYTACDRYASYALASGNYENDDAPMEFWLDETGKPDFTVTDHGAEDLRMLGPAKHYGRTADVHARIWACSCDYTYHNSDMISEPWFAGYARIRAGVTGETLYYLTQNGGIPPKFGNKNRPYLLSFRSSAAIHYQILDEYGGVSVNKKWMPQYEAFSDIDLGKSFIEYPWKHYFNENDRFMTYCSQFGLLQASNTVNGITISERLVRADDNDPLSKLKRFSFDEIFIPRYTRVGLAYPESRKQYYVGISDPKPISAWLTYKDYPGPGGTSLAIQWAWREAWKPLERELLDLRAILRDAILSDCTTNLFYSNYFSFLNISYLNYTYDYRIKEFRRIPKENVYKINWEPSIIEPGTPEELCAPVHFIISIADGPIRVLNSKLELITKEEDLDDRLKFDSITVEELKKHIKFYDVCSGSSWLNSISGETDLETFAFTNLFSDGFIVYDPETAIVDTIETAQQNAINGERDIVYYKNYEEEHYYFNRGLYFNINKTMLSYIPKDLVVIELPYELRLSKPSNDDTDYSNIDINEFYPADDSLGITYLFQSATVTITFKLPQPAVIGKVDIVFSKGREVDPSIAVDPEHPENTVYNYYHTPEVVLRRSTDGATFEDVQQYPFESSDIETPKDFVNKSYTITNIDLDYMSEPSSSFSVTFNYSEDQITFESTPGLFFHFIHIASIKLYNIFYKKQSEYIILHERKFHISVGTYGTYPIHGFESQGSLLYPNPFELSTIYQFDNAYGMVGMSNSEGDFTSGGKTRDRIARPIQQDGEPLDGSYLDFEKKQKELYDDIALSGTEEIIFTSLTTDIFKETFNNVGINEFPEWSCSFKNSIMIPLKAVPEKEKYYPEGHVWTWDTKSFKDVYNCGGGGIRTTTTTFAYKWARVSGIYGFVYERDVFDLYSYGLSDVLTKMANPADTIQDRLNSL